MMGAKRRKCEVFFLIQHNFPWFHWVFSENFKVPSASLNFLGRPLPPPSKRWRDPRNFPFLHWKLDNRMMSSTVGMFNHSGRTRVKFTNDCQSKNSNPQIQPASTRDVEGVNELSRLVFMLSSLLLSSVPQTSKDVQFFCRPFSSSDFASLCYAPILSIDLTFQHFTTRENGSLDEFPSNKRSCGKLQIQ